MFVSWKVATMNEKRALPSGVGSTPNDASTNKARLTHYILQGRYGDGYTYTKTTCATCSSELDTSELALYTKDQNVYCRKSKSLNHPLLSCVQGCGLNFHTLKDLREHCRTTNHKALRCPVPGCVVALSGLYQGEDHLKTCHGGTKLACHQCEELFGDTANLDIHASNRGHSAYICRYPDCESIAGRFSDLIRHQACHKKDVPRHPCPHCRTYRGNNGFKRKDHLRQHIRNYHKIESNHIGWIGSSPFLCKHINCQSYAVMERQNLRSLDDLTQHMLTEHNSSAFICDKMSCDRVGLNGFETKKLFQDHLKKEHPSPFQCTHPGCDRIGSKGWLREKDQTKHMFQKHGISV
ncbi:similar to transcription factor Zn, C2H2 [Botrytis cinerea T4]|uniref:Similar to transcription factor Zn, C2H2 n=1 Tax=Botryotinia fuckeliana (strain T4) TaxID=999810 RepID=G2YU61_BOTF4|nr:similar to transcription factor Zn, C2H2 [Botrytis cinerea T4]